MPASKQRRSKDWGREIENGTKRKLTPVFPGLKRTGSVNYTKDAPDLVAPADDGCPVFPVVVTKDKGAGNDLLVTMVAEHFVQLVLGVYPEGGPGAVIQCKGRAKTWLGGLMRGLRAAARASSS